MNKEKAERIAQLNDLFRKNPTTGGRFVATASVAALGSEFLNKALKALAEFDQFDEDNDPHKERDFISFTVENTKLFFKIDYYDKTMQYASEDPSDPARTIRVGTLMLPEDY